MHVSSTQVAGTIGGEPDEPDAEGLRLGRRAGRRGGSLPGDRVVPAFVIVEVSEADAADLAANRLVEDITDQYAIPIGGDAPSTIDASVPRITTRGTTASHPDYKGAKRLAPGPHHYLVQFAGPMKPEWLDAVRAAGGEVVDTYAGFTIVVRAERRADRADRATPSRALGGSSPAWRAGLGCRSRCAAAAEDQTAPRHAHRRVLHTARDPQGSRRDPQARSANRVRRSRRGRARRRVAGGNRRVATTADRDALPDPWRADGATQGAQPDQQRHRRRADEGQRLGARCGDQGRRRPARSSRSATPDSTSARPTRPIPTSSGG